MAARRTWAAGAPRGPGGPSGGDVGAAHVAAREWVRRRGGQRPARADTSGPARGKMDLFFFRVSDGGRRDPNGGGINRHKWS